MPPESWHIVTQSSALFELLVAGCWLLALLNGLRPAASIKQLSLRAGLREARQSSIVQKCYIRDCIAIPRLGIYQLYHHQDTEDDHRFQAGGFVNRLKPTKSNNESASQITINVWLMVNDHFAHISSPECEGFQPSPRGTLSQRSLRGYQEPSPVCNRRVGVRLL